MLKDRISIVKMKEIYSKQLEEENNEYLRKLEYIVGYSSNPKNWKNTRKTIDIFNFINEIQGVYGNELTDKQIKSKIDKMYSSLNKTKRRK